MVSKPLFRAAALGLAALIPAVPCSAQTLEYRSPSQPAPPADPAAAAHPVGGPPILPAGTSLQVESVRHYPMKGGTVIDGRLVYPLYVDGKLVVPENTPVRGTVTALNQTRKSAGKAVCRA